MSNRENPFCAIPNELIRAIVDFLPANDAQRFALACTRFVPLALRRAVFSSVEHVDGARAILELAARPLSLNVWVTIPHEHLSFLDGMLGECALFVSHAAKEAYASSLGPVRELKIWFRDPFTKAKTIANSIREIAAAHDGGALERIDHNIEIYRASKVDFAARDDLYREHHALRALAPGVCVCSDYSIASIERGAFPLKIDDVVSTSYMLCVRNRPDLFAALPLAYFESIAPPAFFADLPHNLRAHTIDIRWTLGKDGSWLKTLAHEIFARALKLHTFRVHMLPLDVVENIDAIASLAERWWECLEMRVIVLTPPRDSDARAIRLLHRAGVKRMCVRVDETMEKGPDGDNGELLFLTCVDIARTQRHLARKYRMSIRYLLADTTELVRALHRCIVDADDAGVVLDLFDLHEREMLSVAEFDRVWHSERHYIHLTRFIGKPEIPDRVFDALAGHINALPGMPVIAPVLHGRVQPALFRLLDRITRPVCIFAASVLSPGGETDRNGGKRWVRLVVDALRRVGNGCFLFALSAGTLPPGLLTRARSPNGYTLFEIMK